MEPILTEPPTSGPLLKPGDPYSTTTSQMDPTTTTADQQGLQPSQADASGWSPSASSSMVESPVAVPAYNSTGGPGSFPLEDDLQLPASNSSLHFSQYSSSGYNGDPYYYSGGSQRSTLDGDDGGMPGSNIHFVYANERRFQDFHALFRSVPEDERLIEGKLHHQQQHSMRPKRRNGCDEICGHIPVVGQTGREIQEWFATLGGLERRKQR